MSINPIDLSYPKPPFDAVMPAAAQEIIVVAFAATSIIFLIYAIYLAAKWKNILPILFWLGGLCSVMVEGVADLNLHAIHPPVGQWSAFAVHGHPIPWHILFVYPAYYGGTLIALWPIIARRTLTRSLAWKMFAIGAVWVTLIEQIPIHFGLWIYYGPHSVKIGTMPLSMIIPNAASVVMVLLVIYKLTPSINDGWKRLLAIPAVPIAALGTHAGSAVLMYNVMGMDLERIGSGFVNAMTAISIVIGIVAVWMVIELCQDRSDTSRPLAG